MTQALDLSLDHKVADMSLADFGKKEMQLSEREMPGLMECIKKYGPQKPLKGLRVRGRSRAPGANRRPAGRSAGRRGRYPACTV